jgi:tight adherence protein C
MPFELWLVVAAVFMSVALLSGSMATFVWSHAAPGRRRVRELAQAPDGSPAKETPSLTPGLTPAAQRLVKIVPKSPKEMSKLQRRMAQAGYQGATPAVIFAASELLLPVAIGGGAFLLFHGTSRFLFAMMGAMVGYIAPGLALQWMIAKRKKIIQNGLPDALDLFIVCLESGSSLDQAILKTSQDLDVAYPPLAYELRLITTEMRAGKPRLEAFKNFAVRSGVEDVKTLVSMLVQSDRFGVSIAQALRTHAASSRTKRRQRAEERAARIGVKLVFPLVFCLFPAFYVVTLGAAVIKIVEFFSQTLNL